MTTLTSDVFNIAKTDYADIKPIFNQQSGLFDTVNKKHPEMWSLYKTLKNLDWDENDFDYSICNQQFKNCTPNVYDRMIKTIAWQWETDSIASRLIAVIINCVEPASDIAAGYARIIDNENVHAATYSEIVRNSFDDPEAVLADILAVRESLTRLEVIGAIFSKAKTSALNYALDPSTYTQEVYNDIFMFFIALYCMERIQFMASFAITFSICQTTGLFQPIGAGVQKIAQEEYEVHVQYGMAMLTRLMQTPEGKVAYQQKQKEIVALVNEIVASEIQWNEYTFQDDEEIVGVNRQMIDNWIYYNASDAANFLDVADEMEFPMVGVNPLKFMDKWLKISNIQRSPQEENKGDYKVNVVVTDDDDMVFDEL